LIVAPDKESRSRNERYFTTTERLNVNLGSEQYQALNLSMAARRPWRGVRRPDVPKTSRPTFIGKLNLFE